MVGWRRMAVRLEMSREGRSNGNEVERSGAEGMVHALFTGIEG